MERNIENDDETVKQFNKFFSEKMKFDINNTAKGLEDQADEMQRRAKELESQAKDLLKQAKDMRDQADKGKS